MKQRSLLLVLCLFTLTAEDCDPPDVLVRGIPSPVYEGEVLPPLTFDDRFQYGNLELRVGDRNGAVAPMFGTTRIDISDGGTVIFDDIILPSTGVFAFSAQLEGKGKIKGYSEPFTVTTRNFAEVTCQEDGSIIGATSSQTPRPTIIGAGSCKLTKGGGDPVPANFGTVRCDFLNLSASCTAPSGNCFDRGPRMPIPLGTSVSASWSGGDMPEGTATAVRPGAIDAGPPPATQSLSAPLRISFTGSPGGSGTVHLTVMQQTNSTVAIDCWVPETAGAVDVPTALLGQLVAGGANVLLRIEGRARAPSGEFDTTLIVPGPTVAGYLNAVPITLVP